jgi:4-aminobutyrate aminotransferase/(S)-3-amino-2-methylpropionate transaminase
MKPNWNRRPVGTLRAYDPLSEMQFVRSEGAYLWDSEGKPYIDLVCGYSACNLGHRHPRLLEALGRAASELSWAYGGESPIRVELEESIASFVERELVKAHQTRAGQGSLKVWLGVSGARAIETAWKIAQTHRPGGIACMDIAYHGRSMTTAWISDSRRVGSSPGIITRLPFPKHLQGTCSGENCSECEQALAASEEILGRHEGKLGTLILEPAIGARGYYFASAVFYRRLVALARKLSMLVISDEIQMGLRRMGSMVSSLAQGWEADLWVFGKSLGGGMMPLSAVVGASHLIDGLPPGFESETFAGYPLVCPVAIEALRLLSDENLGVQVEQNGERLRKSLHAMLPRSELTPMSHSMAVVVDGVGLATSLSLEHLEGLGTELARDWAQELGNQGVLVHLTGLQRSRLALIPPLTIDAALLDEVAARISRAYEQRVKNNIKLKAGE